MPTLTTDIAFSRGNRPLFIRGFVTGMFGMNSWFLRDTDTGATAIVDPGDSVLEHLDDAGLLDGLKLDHIFLTHAHLDHVWGLTSVHERFPAAPITMHADDVPLLEALPRQGAMVGLPIELPDPPKPTRLVGEGDTVTLGARSASIIHTPGHTRGGICYVFDTGDCFLGDMIIAGSVGRTDLPGGEPMRMTASLRRLCALDPEIWIYGGHGPQSRLGDELLSNAVLPSIIRSGRM